MLPPSITWGLALNTCHCLGTWLKCRLSYFFDALNQPFYSDGFINSTTRIDKLVRAFPGKQEGRKEVAHPESLSMSENAEMQFLGWATHEVTGILPDHFFFLYFCRQPRTVFHLLVQLPFLFAVRHRYCLDTRDEWKNDCHSSRATTMYFQF